MAGRGQLREATASLCMHASREPEKIVKSLPTEVNDYSSVRKVLVVSEERCRRDNGPKP